MLRKVLKVALVFSVGFFMLVSDFSSGVPVKAATDANRVNIGQTSDLSWHGHRTAKFHDPDGNLFYCYDETQPGPPNSRGLTYDFMNHYYDRATVSLLYTAMAAPVIGVISTEVIRIRTMSRRG